MNEGDSDEVEEAAQLFMNVRYKFFGEVSEDVSDEVEEKG